MSVAKRLKLTMTAMPPGMPPLTDLIKVLKHD
jgi:hypothetical protein